jgi:hypothetical protein
MLKIPAFCPAGAIDRQRFLAADGCRPLLAGMTGRGVLIVSSPNKT